MERDIGLLVVGLGPFASCLARMALLAGCGVALHQAEEPTTLRRRMSFSDAWSQGSAALAGVEARLVRDNAGFLGALRGKERIPLLAGPLAQALERWPWDVIVDTRVEEGAERPALPFDAPLRIGVGPGPVAGRDCDIVVTAGGFDPGGILRQGCEPADPRRSADFVLAPASGALQSAYEIGDRIGRRFILGVIDGRVLLAPKSGRIVGLRRPGGFVRCGEAVAEIATDDTEPFEGLGRREQQVARAVLLTIETELEGWAPPPAFPRRSF